MAEYWVYDAGVGGRVRASFPDTVDSWHNLLTVREVYRERATRLGRFFVVLDHTGREVALIGPNGGFFLNQGGE